MNIIIIPLAGRKLAQVGIDRDTTLVRLIDRSIPGTQALVETTVLGTTGVHAFISRVKVDKSCAQFADNLTWFIDQQ